MEAGWDSTHVESLDRDWLAGGVPQILALTTITTITFPAEGGLQVLAPGELPTFQAYLRGVPSSKGGMMTTLTVTEVRSRSIIWSWVSVTTATLQISTRRLPCRRPACQANP